MKSSPNCRAAASTPKLDIRHAAGDIGGDGGVGEFHLLRAVDFGLVDPVQRQQLVEQQPRAGIMVAVDEARLALDDIPCSDAIFSGLPRLTISPISRVTKLMTRSSRGSSHSLQARMPCARNSPRGRCTPERSQAPCASDTSEFWLLT